LPWVYSIGNYATLKPDMIVHKLQELVKKALKQDAKVSFEHPENPEHGDYSTNVALLLGQQTKENPRDIAEKLKESIKKSKSVSKIEVAGPGFVNFFLSQEYLLKELQEIVKQKEKYGKGKNQRKKIMVEFTDPNPFKEFHIGHLYSNIVGESLSRLLEATGARVKRANYQGDVGLHVARAIWGMTQIPHRPKERDPLSAKTKWLGMCYASRIR
jgi:arginyl-tRNA synthetase